MNDHLSTDLLLDFIHGELAPEDDAPALAHLAGCAACREAHALELSVGEALRRTAAAEEREMPSLVAAAVWQRVREAQPGPLARMTAWLRPAIAVPLAAALVAGAFFASPLGHSGAARPTIDASYYLETHAAQTEQTPLSERSGPQILETSSAAGPERPVADTGFVTSGTFDAVQ